MFKEVVQKASAFLVRCFFDVLFSKIREEYCMNNKTMQPTIPRLNATVIDYQGISGITN